MGSLFSRLHPNAVIVWESYPNARYLKRNLQSIQRLVQSGEPYWARLESQP